MGLQLLKTNYFFPKTARNGGDGFDKLMVVTKDENGQKDFKIVQKPTIEYAVSKPHLDISKELRSIKIEDADVRKCYYKNLFTDMTEAINDPSVSEYYNLVMSDPNKTGFMDKLRKIHLDYRVHGTDVNIEDYYIGKFLEQNPAVENNYKLTKFFYDIEVDTSQIVGFPDPELAECPVNIISAMQEINGEIQVYMLCLHYEDDHNPSYKEFFDNLKDRVMPIKENLMKKTGKEVKFTIKRFRNELNLISTFFDIINDNRPDFVLGWNTHRFDMPYIYNRLSFLLTGTNTTIEDIMCPKEMPYKTASYRIDRFKQDASDNASKVNIASYSIHIDQMNLYANLRKGKGKLENYDLDTVSTIELGEKKERLETSIKTQHFDNYTNFFEYSVQDTLLLLLLENSINDIEALYAVSTITETRVEECLKKTVCLRNLASKFYKKNGYLISNNRSSLKEKKGKPRGAYVARTDLVENIGMELWEGALPSQYLFEEVCDVDLSSLYPSIIIALNLSPETFLFKIIIQELNKETQEYVNIEDVMVDEYISKDYVSLGKKYLDLPDMNELDQLVQQEIA